MMPLLIPNKQVLNPTEYIKTPITARENSSSTSSQSQNLQQTSNQSSTNIPAKQITTLNNTTSQHQLPPAIQQALSKLTYSLTSQKPLSELLNSLLDYEQLSNDTQLSTEANTTTKTNNPTKDNSIQKILSQMFQQGVNLTSDKSSVITQLQQAIRHYNIGINKHKTQGDWQSQLEQLITETDIESIAPELASLARGWLARSGHNAFMQQLQLNAGNPVLLQDIPVAIDQQWHGVHLEIEQEQNQNQEAEWKVLIQFTLSDTVSVSSKLTLNAQQEIHVYLWTNDPNTTQALQENVQNLNKSLHDIGLLPQPIFIATGKAPQGKDTQQPSLLAGTVNLST